ncbi:Conserved_hypothetical protein [Hexamita inflata]|uniref:Uncharacterized protein n=1 Tax=Hexamita inflata TaxID=28002 RepID=A0ABP1HWP6_9EUKA
MRGFSINQARADPSVSYEINKRRQDDSVRTFYENAVADDHRIANINRTINRRIVPAVERLTMDQIRMKILASERVRREQLERIFNQELVQYQKITNTQKQEYESQTINRLQDRVDQINAQKSLQTQEYVQVKRQQQFQNNCDELRGRNELINARANRIQWELQALEQKKNRDYEKQIDRALDQITLNDFQLFQQERQQAYLDKLEDIKRQQIELTNETNKRIQLKQSMKNEEMQLFQKEQELRALGAEVEQMQINLMKNESKFNCEELKTQQLISETLKRKQKDEKLKEGREDVKNIQAEIDAQKRRDLENQKNLKEMQDIYQGVEKERQNYKKMEEQMIDTLFLQDIHAKDAKQLQREQNETLRRKQIANEQTTWNYEIAEHKRLRVESKAETKNDLLRSIEELKQYKEFEQKQFEDKKREQAEYLIYLQKQDEVKAEKSRTLIREDRDYANQVKNELEETNRTINGKLGLVDDRMRELDSIKLQNEEKYKPKKQWYNV